MLLREAHCDVATRLARNINNGSVTGDVLSPSPGFCEVEASLIDESKLMQDHISIHFQYSLKKKSVNMVQSSTLGKNAVLRIVYCSQLCTYIHIHASDL